MKKPPPPKLQTSQLRFQAKWYQNLVVCFLAKVRAMDHQNAKRQGIPMGIHIFPPGNYTIAPTSNKLLVKNNIQFPQGGICDRYMEGTDNF